MDAFDDDAYAARFEHVLNAMRDLRSQRFLHLKPPRERLDDARELADADDFAVRKIADVHLADDRRHVMLAMRLEADVAQHDHLVVAVDLAKRAPQELERVVVVAAEPVLVRADDASRRADEPLALGIVADPLEQRAHGCFGFFARGFGFARLWRGRFVGVGSRRRSRLRRKCRQSKSRLLGGATDGPRWHIDRADRSQTRARMGVPPSSSIVSRLARGRPSRSCSRRCTRRRARLTARPGIESCWRRTATTAASSAAVASRAISPNARAAWSRTARAAAVTYDLRDAADELWGLGVGCNGLLRVFLQPLLPANDYQPFAAIAERLAGTRRGRRGHGHRERAAGRRRRRDGRRRRDRGARVRRERSGRAAAARRRAAPRSRAPRRGLATEQGCRILHAPLRPIPKLLVLGAGLDAIPLVGMAAELGWFVTVADHRPGYLARGGFERAERAVLVEPRRLAAALPLARLRRDRRHEPPSGDGSQVPRASSRGVDTRYLGVLGPRARRDRLLEELADAAPQLRERLKGPVGLDIGADSPGVDRAVDSRRAQVRRLSDALRIRRASTSCRAGCRRAS